MGRNIYKPNITINQDWTDIFSLHKQASDKIRNQSKTNNWLSKSSEFEKVQRAGSTNVAYHLGDGIEIDHSEIGPPQVPDFGKTINFRGPKLLSMLLWIDKFLEDTKELEPRIDQIGFYDFAGTYPHHIDPPEWATSFLYFLTDCESYTYVWDDEGEEAIRSDEHTAWIFDAQKDHRAKNFDPNIRYAFIVRFGQPFSVCRKWFEDHDGIVYG